MVKPYKIFLFLFFLACLTTHTFAQEGLIINKISFSGNDSIPKETLLEQMNTQPRTFIEKLKFWKKSTGFSSFTFESDLRRLKKVYQRNGFPDPEITHELDRGKKDKKLEIILHIDQGPAVMVDSVNYHLSGSDEARDVLDSLKKEAPLRTGTRFRDEQVLTTERLLRNGFTNMGYPFIELEKNITLNEEKKLAAVDFSIDPGNKSYLGEIRFEGDSLVSRKYMNQHIEMEKGQVFSPGHLNQTQNDLFRLGLFRYVTVRAITDSVQDNHIPILVRVNELPRWAFNAGVGYGTEDRVRLSLQMTRRNFLGGGRSLNITAKHSYFIPFSIETKFIQPDLGLKNLDFIVNPFFSSEREESYTVDRLGSAFTFQKNFKKNNAYISYTYGKDAVNLSISPDTLSDETIQKENNIKSGITLGFNRNSTDNLFSPTKGWKINSTATYMGLATKSRYHYYRLEAEISWFRQVGGSVLATKLKGGVLQPTRGDATTPIEDRFLMGGAMSLRGWGRHQVSPENEEGDKIGGNSMLEGSVEWRFPIAGIFSGVVFADAGDAWENPWEFNFSQLLYNAGTGLRVQTPVGPVRLDVATPLMEGKFDARFFITIGHAF